MNARTCGYTRGGQSFNHQYPHLVEALDDLPDGTVVDGEVVALDETGRPNFNLLQNFRSEASRIDYFIFDLLICQDRDLTRLPLTERRKLMKSVLKLRSPHIRIAEQFEASANDNYQVFQCVAHPNWAGTTLLFSKLDESGTIADFGEGIRGGDSARVVGAVNLSVALAMCESSYNEIADLMPAFVKLCEGHSEGIQPIA